MRKLFYRINGKLRGQRGEIGGEIIMAAIAIFVIAAIVPPALTALVGATTTGDLVIDNIIQFVLPLIAAVAILYMLYKKTVGGKV